MKPRPFLLLAYVALWNVATADTPTPQIPQLVLPCVVQQVQDGDSLTAEVKIIMDVRLRKCWAPEITGKEKPEGLKSKKRLEELALGKSGTLTIPFGNELGDSFSFGRTLATVSIAGVDLSEQMVAEGFATKTKPAKRKKGKTK